MQPSLFSPLPILPVEPFGFTPTSLVRGVSLASERVVQLILCLSNLIWL